MSDSLSETKACDLLSRLFRARGYTITRNVLFREYGVEFHVDGWDEKARVGFEFLSSEDEDHIDLSLEEYQTLSDAQRRGELALFIIDEVEPLSAADLVAEADEFLDEAAASLRSRRARAGKPAAGSKSRISLKKPRGAKQAPAGKRGAGSKQRGGGRAVGSKVSGKKAGVKKAGVKKAAAGRPKSSGKAAEKKGAGAMIPAGREKTSTKTVARSGRPKRRGGR